MKNEKYNIVIVEDNENDAELIVRTLNKTQVTNNMIVLVDGEQTLDFLFCRGQYNGREKSSVPKVIFLDIKLPKVTGLMYCSN